MLAEIYLENIKASSKFLLTKNWCISVLGDTLAMYNRNLELALIFSKYISASIYTPYSV